MTTGTGVEHLRALADADPDADGDICRASGPGGECARVRGHYDTDTGLGGVLTHYSWDTDQFRSWPVGWKSHQDRIADVFDDHFASTLTGNDSYRQGVEDCLRLVRTTLRPRLGS